MERPQDSSCGAGPLMASVHLKLRGGRRMNRGPLLSSILPQGAQRTCGTSPLLVTQVNKGQGTEPGDSHYTMHS